MQINTNTGLMFILIKILMFMQRFLLLFIGVVLLSLTAAAQNENALYEKGYYGNIELDMGSTFGFSADVPDRPARVQKIACFQRLLK